VASLTENDNFKVAPMVGVSSISRASTWRGYISDGLEELKKQQ